MNYAAGRVLVALFCVVLGACASTPRVMHIEPIVDGTSVWPAPPDSPRYRFVGQLTGEENFRTADQERENIAGKILRWVVGLAGRVQDPNILLRPQAGYVDAAGRVYVTDVSRPCLCVFDTLGGKFRAYELATPRFAFQSPIAVAPGADDTLLVTDSKLGLVAVLKADGTPMAPIGEGKLTRPTGIARDPQSKRIYVADTAVNQIKVFGDDGALLAAFGQHGDQPGQFNSPTFLAVNNGSLFVADTLNSRIQILDLDGNVKRVFGERGLFVGDMPRPKGVAVDGAGLVYVVETYYDHLLVFNESGQFLLPIGGTGYGAGQFYLPSGVWVDNNKRVYVADMMNGRVAVFEYIGDGV